MDKAHNRTDGFLNRHQDQDALEPLGDVGPECFHEACVRTYSRLVGPPPSAGLTNQHISGLLPQNGPCPMSYCDGWDAEHIHIGYRRLRSPSAH